MLIQIKKAKKYFGFTLIESIITIGLIVAIAGSFAGFVVYIMNARSSVQSMQEVDGNLRVALDVVSRKIRNANGVNIGMSVFDSDPGVLSLSMPTPSADPTIFQLDQDNGILVMREGSSQPVSLTTNEVQLTRLIFSLLSGTPSRENISITLDGENSSEDDSYVSFTHSIRTSVSVRQ